MRVRVKVRSQKVTNSRQNQIFRACGTWFMITYARRIKNRSHFAIWLHASQRERRVRSTPGHKCQIFELIFSNKKWLFLNQFDIRIPKMSFFCAMSINAQNRSLKNDVINEYDLGATYMFAKIRYINLKFGMPDVQAWFPTCILFFENFENFIFWKSKI